MASAAGGELTDVSCPSASLCLAVPGSGTAAQAWKGEAWQAAALVEPAKTESFKSRDVSCHPICIAVGTYKSSGAWHAFSEGWDGSEWSLLSTPAGEAGGNDDLNAVSCSSASSCTAVGRKDGATSPSNGKPLALRWDGSKWSELANPGSGAGEISDISCSSSSACTVVFNTASAERWDGSKWSAATLPAPAGGSAPKLRSVSCAAASACVAVGRYTPSAGGGDTLAERWDGSGWEAQTLPDPAGVTVSQTPTLYGVSCVSSALCTAVGGYIHGALVWESFGERYGT